MTINFALAKENKPKNKDSISYTYDELVTYEKLPKYIKDYFYDIKKDLEKNKIDKLNILKRINNKDLFLLEIQTYLERSVNEFMGFNNKHDNEEFDY